MEEGQKLYYTIGEVSTLLSENTSLVRFWSDTFSAFIKPVRNKKGNRLFTAKDVENFKLIHHFVKDLGMTLDGAKLRMKQNATGEDKRLEVISRLKQIRAKLLAVTDEADENPDDEFEILTDLEDGAEEN
ncbi:MAG: MerR family transcriptional regulator [Bacteroidales bacterium]|nr:MerR family transcriptional regulator [Bacteroidales bacterium]MBR4979900.1 MerR family transcriptional regulator [Bacteroidales bacterium]MBR5907687.1 MerR family transcriptional regulator [Bacteroidales bacterium]